MNMNVGVSWSSGRAALCFVWLCRAWTHTSTQGLGTVPRRSGNMKEPARELMPGWLQGTDQHICRDRLTF